MAPVYQTKIDHAFIDKKDPKNPRRIPLKGTITLDRDSYNASDLEAVDETDPKNPVPAKAWVQRGDRLEEAIDIGRKVAINKEQTAIQAQNGNTIGNCSQCLRWGKVPQPAGSFLCVKCGLMSFK
jgi:hypothetical protein